MNVYTTTGTVLLLERALIFFDSVRPSVCLSVFSMHNNDVLSFSYRMSYGTSTPYCDCTDRWCVYRIAIVVSQWLFDSFIIRMYSTVLRSNLSISVRTSSALADAVAAQYFEIFG
jgi:hypothetical protein